LLPEENLLVKTGEVDYYYWNYRFPIRIFQRYRFKSIIRQLGEVRYQSLLEIGTGSGVFLPELSRHCEQLYACDLHSRFEEIEKLCKSYRIENYHLSTQSIEETNFPNNTFDAIVAISVLEFVNDLQKGINEIKRILKENGIFVTLCPMESKINHSLLSDHGFTKISFLFC
jgi:ubiquinone/menaquinone biosynthesis C-methylase UbiE